MSESKEIVVAIDSDDDDDELHEAVQIKLKETPEQRIQRQQSMKELEAHYVEDQIKAFIATESCAAKYLNKGSISNGITACVMVLGIILYFTSRAASPNDVGSIFSTYVLSAGLFGFAGGITNWLAIKMLFDRVPYLYGSGVIPREFKMIRNSVKDTIMKAFFDPEYLESYATDRAMDLLARSDIPAIVDTTLNNPTVHATIVLKLKQISKEKNAAGRFLAMGKSLFPGGINGMVQTVKPVISKMTGDIVPVLLANFDLQEFVSIETVQKEIDKLMTEKLELLTPEMVKELLERVVREHLGWLVVWGNVFGSLIGIVSNAAGLGPVGE